ncbi:MAG: ABC transporter ATP-binding protein [Rhodocyclales bacterium CG17_big_fil_post_rev_8_21_14_2_50_68_7]|nr:MAG: ABC transporter ATP-binding protein [Rhodocyclales bacterium CG17_big_fil_post_rev_8_21_14_2_50_68_7]
MADVVAQRRRLLPLVLDRVGFDAGGRAILAGIDARIEAAVRTVILGPNGSGKSLLMRICHGLLAPTRGAVRWSGPDARRPGVQAMVFQRPVLLRRSALANVSYALKLAGIGRAARETRARAALDRVGLAAVAARTARVLSGGEQQRLALARAWALEPQVLFLDEPTASLDPSAAREVEAIIQAIHCAGTKIVMTTHNLGLAKRFADEILFLIDGRIEEAAPADRFFRQPRSAKAGAFLQEELPWS